MDETCIHRGATPIAWPKKNQVGHRGDPVCQGPKPAGQKRITFNRLFLHRSRIFPPGAVTMTSGPISSLTEFLDKLLSIRFWDK